MLLEVVTCINKKCGRIKRGLLKLLNTSVVITVHDLLFTDNWIPQHFHCMLQDLCAVLFRK